MPKDTLQSVPQEPTELIEDETLTAVEKNDVVKDNESNNNEDSEAVEIEQSTDVSKDAGTSDDKASGATVNSNFKAIDTNPATQEEEDHPPPAPPRPKSPLTKMRDELKDAFPSADDNIVTAVIIASQGNMESSFNALLYLSDPSVEPEVTFFGATPQVPQPKAALSEDELLARRLQRKYHDEQKARRHHPSQRRRQKPSDEENLDDSGDDFAQIKETFTTGLEEARTTLNGWVSDLAKKFDGSGAENKNQNNQQNNTKLFGALGGSSFNFSNRNSMRQGKGAKFDDDIQIIGNDFDNKIKLNDNSEAPSLPKRKQDPAEPKQFEKSEKWENPKSDAATNSDAFLVMDSDDEEAKANNV